MTIMRLTIIWVSPKTYERESDFVNVCPEFSYLFCLILFLQKQKQPQHFPTAYLALICVFISRCFYTPLLFSL